MSFNREGMVKGLICLVLLVEFDVRFWELDCSRLRLKSIEFNFRRLVLKDDGIRFDRWMLH